MKMSDEEIRRNLERQIELMREITLVENDKDRGYAHAIPLRAERDLLAFENGVDQDLRRRETDESRRAHDRAYVEMVPHLIRSLELDLQSRPRLIELLEKQNAVFADGFRLIADALNRG